MAESREQTKAGGGGGFFSKVKELGDKLKETSLHDAHVKATHMKHNMGKFANIINPNHRHDEAHEQATDKKRTAVSESHRFGSFAPERDGNNVKWYVDARDYFWVSDMPILDTQTHAHATPEHLHCFRACKRDYLHRRLVAIT